MRQRLINKTAQPQETLTAGRMAARNAVATEAVSLPSLLFDSTLSKEDWTEGLKHHSKILTHLLLNDQIDDFNAYLGSQFGSEVSELKKE